jgi:hypothetical protein
MNECTFKPNLTKRKQKETHVEPRRTAIYMLSPEFDRSSSGSARSSKSPCDDGQKQWVLISPPKAAQD